MVQSDWSEHMEDWEDEDMNNDLCYCYVGSTRLNTWLNETGHMKNALDISRQPGKRSEDRLQSGGIVYPYLFTASCCVSFKLALLFIFSVEANQGSVAPIYFLHLGVLACQG